MLGDLGQYRLLAKLGEGGMGAVYKALHTRLERVVALKVLSADRLQDPQAVGRFHREMRAVGRLQHPNIVGATDAGEFDGTHYLVMELVEGEDLGRLITRLGSFPIDTACELIRQTALGLQHACEHNLVHRDIKPSNLMLARPTHSGGLPTLKILDMGLALLDEARIEAAGELTGAGQVMGTLDYMAPEQAVDTHAVDIRADIYSLGATLYKMLTGKAPFADPQFNSPMKKLMALANREPPSVMILRRDCPAELADLIHRMLAKSPDDRPTSPSIVATELEKFASGANLTILLEPANTFDASQTSKLDSGATFRAPPTAYELTRTETSPNPSLQRVPSELPTQPIQPCPSSVGVSGGGGGKSRQNNRVWLVAGAFAAIAMLAAVISISTDNGTVVVEAPDDLVHSIQVTLLRKGQPEKENWQIKPGENSVTVRSGRVELVLPATKEDEFDLDQPDSLLVRRGDKVVFTLKRRPAAAVQPNVVRATESDTVKPKTVPQPVVVEGQIHVVKADADKPFVLIGTEQKSREFKRFAEAFAVLRDGDVIEVHGNGPFAIPAIRLENKGLSIRAGKGFRPVFTAAMTLENSSWFHMQGGPLTLEGCDFRAARVQLFAGGGAAWQFRNCRLSVSLQNAMTYAGPRLSITDSMLCVYFGNGILCDQRDAEIELTNTIVRTSGSFLHFDQGHGRGGQKVKLLNNSFNCAHGGLLSPDYREEALPISVEASGNVFDIRSGAILLGNQPIADIRRIVRWHGRKNLYCGPQWASTIARDENAKLTGLKAWEAFWGDAETESIEAPAAAFTWDSVRCLPLPEAMAWLRKFVDEAKRQNSPEIADLGPDWDLIGPGDAYVRALAQRGMPVPPEQLRLESPDSGPFVLLRGGKIQSGYLTLQDALNVAKSDDEIEIRTDGPFSGATTANGGNGRRLTIRAAPGYLPVMDDDLFYPASGELTVEGIQFKNGSISTRFIEAEALHLINCAFNPVTGAHFDMWARPNLRSSPTVVNCWAPTRVSSIAIDSGCSVVIRNSVMGPSFVQARGAGDRQFGFERCVIWNPGVASGESSPLSESAFYWHPEGTITFSLEKTAVLTTRLVHGDINFEQCDWKNSHNLYCTGVPWLLDSLRTTGNSGDEGSRAADPIDFDPRQWRLLPGMPGHQAGDLGQDFGADVNRIARITAETP